MQIIECFTSLQGESTRAGEKCFFIRLSGCNLRCNYCDTVYAYTGGTEYSIAQLIELAKTSGVHLVEITGGEPLLSTETPELCRELLTCGFEVMIETNGSLPVDVIPEGVKRIIDCKLPDSGMFEHNCFDNFKNLSAGDEIKFVVSYRRDFDCALQLIRDYDLESSPAVLLVSPVWGKVDFADLADWVKNTGVRLKMQLQLHKLIWGNAPGV